MTTPWVSDDWYILDFAPVHVALALVLILWLYLLYLAMRQR